MLHSYVTDMAACVTPTIQIPCFLTVFFIPALFFLFSFKSHFVVDVCSLLLLLKLLLNWKLALFDCTSLGLKSWIYIFIFTWN